jgi:glutaredoxin 3
MSENKAFQVKEDSFFTELPKEAKVRKRMKSSFDSSSAKASERKVRLFSTPGCPYCFTLKEFLKEHNVSFGEIDVSEDEKSRDYIIEKTGKMEAPIVEIDGEIVVGFDKEKICKLLKLKE